MNETIVVLQHEGEAVEIKISPSLKREFLEAMQLVRSQHLKPTILVVNWQYLYMKHAEESKDYRMNRKVYKALQAYLYRKICTFLDIEVDVYLYHGLPNVLALGE